MRNAKPVVLVVDDYEDTKRVVAELVAKVLGVEVATAKDGPQALTVAAHLRPAVIIFELRLPVLDGIAAARQLRASRPRNSARLIAYTVLSADADREAAHAAGFEFFIVKPGAPEELVKSVRACLASALS